jgi:hypothetical protein
MRKVDHERAVDDAWRLSDEERKKHMREKSLRLSRETRLRRNCLELNEAGGQEPSKADVVSEARLMAM